MKYKNILFDLDGTITDSSPGIINSYLHSLNKIGLAEDEIRIDSVATRRSSNWVSAAKSAASERSSAWLAPRSRP